MTHTKHTPGPWYEDDGAINAKWETGEEIQVALAWGTRWSQPDGGKNKRMREESKANVRLIAAAPELLEVCKAIEAGPDNNCAEIHLTDNYQQGLFCGLEDMDITDRYNACMYGFNKAVERVVAWAQGMVEAAIAKATE